MPIANCILKLRSILPMRKRKLASCKLQAELRVSPSTHRGEEMSHQLATLEGMLKEAHDLINSKDWEPNDLCKGIDQEVAQAWNEARKAHKQEL